jgi:hypothetical protein
MGMPRERRIFVGLGAVAVAGLMFDKVFLAPAGAAAAPAEIAAAGPAGVVESAVAAAGSRLESGLREAIGRALAEHASEALPAMEFGPRAAWTERAVPGVIGQPAQTPAAAPAGEFLPGLARVPQLSLVMPTSRGGVAVIDGQRLVVGQTHPDGFVLTGVQERSVTISLGGSTAVLSLPSPGN